MTLGLKVYAHCHTTAEKNIYTTLLPLSSDAWYNHHNIIWWAQIMKVLVSHSWLFVFMGWISSE